VPHLRHFCRRNLKNEMPLNKSPKTVVENSFSRYRRRLFTGVFKTATASLHLRERKAPAALMALIVVFE
jgi:hypothetical protein